MKYKDISIDMANKKNSTLICDGCGQPPEKSLLKIKLHTHLLKIDLNKQATVNICSNCIFKALVLK